MRNTVVFSVLASAALCTCMGCGGEAARRLPPGMSGGAGNANGVRTGGEGGRDGGREAGATQTGGADTSGGGPGEPGGTGHGVCEGPYCSGGHVVFGGSCSPYVTCDPATSGGVECVPFGQPCPSADEGSVDAGSCVGVDTASEPTNCGACGHACAPTTLASGQPFPTGRLAVDAKNVYWSSGGNDAVWQMPVDGGSPARIADQAGSSTDAITVDANHVYWATLDTNTGTASLKKVPIGGGTPATLVSGLSIVASNIVVDPTSVYWLAIDRNGSVMKVSIDGGTPVTLASSDGGYAVAVDSTSLYYTTLSRTEANRGAVMKVALGGGTPVTLASVQSPGTGGALAVDGSSVYWTSFIDNDHGAVLSVPIGGGAVRTLASGLARPGALAVDATDVYWTSLGSTMGPVGRVGEVAKVPLSGGRPTTLASKQGDPGSIAVGAAGVFWVNDYFDGRVMRIDKDPCRGGSCR